MNMSRVGTCITLTSAIAMYAFIFLIVVLASKDLLPEDPDNMLFYIVLAILVAMLGGMIAGTMFSFIGGRCKRKKQNPDNAVLTDIT